MSAFQIVNGFVCFCCDDVSLAKKDINPAHPPGSPGGPPAGAQTPAPSNTQSAPAVTFGGSLTQLTGASAVQQPGAVGGSAGVAASPYNPPVGGLVSLSA